MSKTQTVKDTTGKDVTLSVETIQQLVSAHAPAPAIDLAKFTELQSTVASQGQTIASQGATITELSTKNASLELAANTRTATDKVESLIRAGKATKAEQDALLELALANGPLFDKLAATRPVIVELNTETGTGGEGPHAGMKNAELALAIKAEQDADPKITAEQAFSRALEKNPKLYHLAQVQ